MENKKITLWVIIVLLIILAPITIFSTSMHFSRLAFEENKNHEFHYNGKLYFYKNDQLLGTYTCENPSGYCDYAIEMPNDSYSLAEREIEESEKITTINDRYVFLIDTNSSQVENANIILYDLSAERKIGEYKKVKDYQVGIDHDYYIIQNQNNLWGVFSLENDIVAEIPFQYNYIGLPDQIDEDTNKIESEIFATLKDEKWQLLTDNETIFSTNEEIVTYNDKYVVLKNENFMSLVDYDEKIILNNLKYINFYNDYIIIISLNNEFYIYDINQNQKISNSYFVNNIDDIDLKTENNELQIFVKDQLEQTIAIE